jgi:hypothetical protein
MAKVNRNPFLKTLRRKLTPPDGPGPLHIEARRELLTRFLKLQEEVAAEKGIRADTLRRMVAKVEEYSESHRAQGLPDDLLNILKDDLDHETSPPVN